MRRGFVVSVIIVLLAMLALLGIKAVLFNTSSDELFYVALMLSIIAGICCLSSLTGLRILRSPRLIYKVLGIFTILSSIFTFAAYAYMAWMSDSEYGYNYSSLNATLTAFILTFSVSQISLLLPMRKASLATKISLVGTIVCVVAVATMPILLFWGHINTDSYDYWRWFVALVILDAFGTITTALLEYVYDK